MHRFFDSCKCTLPEETNDFQNVIKHLLAKPAFVSLMPAIHLDLWPLHVLECTNGRQYPAHDGRNHICFMPVGAHDFWALGYFTALIQAFYRDEDMAPYAAHWYGAELDEMILLRSEACTRTVRIESAGDISAAYARFSFPGGKRVHLFLLLTTAQDGWRSIFQQYRIPCDILIDSNKGLGDWLESTALYPLLTADPLDPILPAFYFKGKYISHGAPEGFVRIYEVPESDAHACVSEIYQARWQHP